jgi:hypothetical protein
MNVCAVAQALTPIAVRTAHYVDAAASKLLGVLVIIYRTVDNNA